MRWDRWAGRYAHICGPPLWPTGTDEADRSSSNRTLRFVDSEVPRATTLLQGPSLPESPVPLPETARDRVAPALEIAARCPPGHRFQRDKCRYSAVDQKRLRSTPP